MNKRRALIAYLLAPFGKQVKAQEPETLTGTSEFRFPQRQTFQSTGSYPVVRIDPFPFSVQFVLPGNKPETVLLTVEAFGRKVTFTTAEVMDILEGKA